jgi:anti-sigma B factor antagonist
MADFKVSSREQGQICIIDVGGYLDAHTASELEKEFEKLIEDGQYKVVVNFSDLNYISSAGLGVFMAYVEPMREHGGDIKFTNLKEDVYSIFNLLGFPILYEFFDQEEDAIKKFNQ